jgi:hypothetical protein
VTAGNSSKGWISATSERASTGAVTPRAELLLSLKLSVTMIDIELIPRIMRNFGMRRGQQLMETWFSHPAARYPCYSRPVTNIMTWTGGAQL